jgi:transcription elongation factor Elf1
MVGHLRYNCPDCGTKSVVEYDLHKGSLVTVDPEECSNCGYDWTDDLVEMFEGDFDEDLEKSRQKQFVEDINSNLFDDVN